MAKAAKAKAAKTASKAAKVKPAMKAPVPAADSRVSRPCSVGLLGLFQAGQMLI
jgi:hypothetical protein